MCIDDVAGHLLVTLPLQRTRYSQVSLFLRTRHPSDHLCPTDVIAETRHTDSAGPCPLLVKHVVTTTVTIAWLFVV